MFYSNQFIVNRALFNNSSGKKLAVAPLKNCACIRFAQEASAHNTDAEMMEDERGDARFVLAELA